MPTENSNTAVARLQRDLVIHELNGEKELDTKK